MTEQCAVSVVVLTYARPDEIRTNVTSLLRLAWRPLEIVVVDNASPEPVAALLPEDPRLRVLRLEENRGVGGRNAGLEAANGEVVITLDDDVTGLTDADIGRIVTALREDDVAAVNFRVLDAVTGAQMNWCHHRRIEEYGTRHFDTYEISEGAVAFRREAVLRAGLYPEYFFISHEGPDLALRLMNLGLRVVYNPEIAVRHSHSDTARVSWRRYYYDTRNQLWFVARRLPYRLWPRKLGISLLAMCFYALRDGFLRYWARGLFDGLRGLPRALRERDCISRATLERYRRLEACNPGFWYMLGKRVFRRRVGI